MISCILTSLVIALVSMLLGGIPIIFFLIMIESSGLIDYVLALTLLIFSVLELIKFIFVTVMERDLDFSIKNVFGTIKSLFKKKSKRETNKKNKNKIEVSDKMKVFQIILVLIFVVIGIIHKPHSILLDLVYDNLIVRILYSIFVPLIICDVINSFRDGMIDGIGDFFTQLFGIILIPSIIGIILSTSFVATAKMFHEDVLENQIKPLFIYDNREYDELRSGEEFSSEIDYLKNSFFTEITNLKAQYDINDKNSYQNMKNILFRDIDIGYYGYQVTDKEWENDDTVVLCVVDEKTRNHNIYKLNLRENTLVLSSPEEFKNIRKINYENKKNK